MNVQAVTQGAGMIVRIDERDGTLVHIGHPADTKQENYIASRSELPLIGAETSNAVEGYGAVLLGYKVNGEEGCRRHWLPFSVDPDGNQQAFVFENEAVRVVKAYAAGQELRMVLTVEGKADAVQITELALSVPVNNYYCPWRYDQRYLYNYKVYEHIHPGGEHGYQLIERLNGTEPLLYCIPLAGTRFEHTAHYPGSIDLERERIANHSWPGSSLLFLHAAGYLEQHGFKPLLDRTLASSAVLAAGEVKRYELELGFAASREQFAALLASRGKIDAVAVPSMSGPLDQVFQIIARGSGELALVPSEQFEVVSEREVAGGKAWRIKFQRAGEQLVWLAGGSGAPAPMAFRITEPLEGLLERRAAFILDHQVFREEGHVLDGAIVPYTTGPFCEFTEPGLCAKPESIWGCGSYEGGITDAMFAAEKNVLQPDPRQVAQLEEYIRTYVRRFLQNPDNDEVIWWIGSFSAARSYNYMHVANLYYSMYRIAKLHQLTALHTANDYLLLAYRTLMKMYEASRPMDLITGLMGGQRIFAILGGLQAEEMVECYYTLLIKVRQHGAMLFQGDVPYGSECAFDNTGYECVAYYAHYFQEAQCLREIAAVMLAARGNQPIWWWQGSDIRWWDAGADFAETCHHYTSPLNSEALLMLIRKGLLRPDVPILSGIYAGLLGTATQIHEDGRASMSYCWEQESANYGDHVSTGDVGLGLFGTLLGLRAFAYVSQADGTVGYLCDAEEVADKQAGDGSGEYSVLVKPLAAASCKLSWHIEGASLLERGDAESTGWRIQQLRISQAAGLLQAELFLPAASATPELAQQNASAATPELASAVAGATPELILRCPTRPLVAYASGQPVRIEPIAADEYRIAFADQPADAVVAVDIHFV